MKDLKDKALRGGFSKISAQIVNFAFRIGSIMVLARLLDPNDFGLVAMATLITAILELFKDAGLSMATVQHQTINNEQMSTLFWINLLVGFLLASLLIAISPVMAEVYHEPRLIAVSTVLAVSFLFTGASAQHCALLERQMGFGKLAGIEIIAQIVSIAVAIALAVKGWGYWALVGQLVAMPCTSAICVWLVVRWMPGLPSRKADIRSMMRFGGIVTLNSLIAYVAFNLDKFLLGRFLGAEALGIYGKAYQLISIPSGTINASISGVAFATLSRIQDDPSRQKRYFLKIYAFLIALSFPITTAFAIFSDDLILILLGEKWHAAAPIFRLLAPTVLIFSLINPFSWFLYATGRAGRSLKTAFVIAPLVITAYFIGLPYGVSGVASAYSAAMTLWVMPHIAWCIYGTGVSARDIFQAVSRPFVAGIFSAVLAICVEFYFGHLLPPLLRLGLGGSVMVVCYLWLLLFVMGQKAYYLDFFQGMRQRPLKQ